MRHYLLITVVTIAGVFGSLNLSASTAISVNKLHSLERQRLLKPSMRLDRQIWSYYIGMHPDDMGGNGKLAAPDYQSAEQLNSDIDSTRLRQWIEYHRKTLNLETE